MVLWSPTEITSKNENYIEYTLNIYELQQMTVKPYCNCSQMKVIKMTTDSVLLLHFSHSVLNNDFSHLFEHFILQIFFSNH